MKLRLLDRLNEHARRTPHATAVREVARGSAVTWRELADAVAILAATLARQVAPGGVVLLACPNDARFIASFLGVLAAGGRVFPVAPDLTVAELDAAVKRSGATAAIGEKSVLAVVDVELKVCLPGIGSGLWPHDVDTLQGWPLTPALSPGYRGEGEGASTRSNKHAGADIKLVARDLSRAGMLLQSSGTTGLPKIVFRGGASLDAVAGAMCESIGFGPADRVLMCLPLCHSYGVEHGLLAPVMAGSCIHLCDGFDLNVVRSQFAQAAVTIFPGVPFMFEALSRLDGADTLPSLRRAYSAGAPLPASVYESFFARYRVRVSQLYGATEIGSVTYGDPLCDGFDPAGVGRPMRGVSIRVLDLACPEVMKPIAPEAEGHVAVAAESMLSAYADDERTPLVDGFFLTGDLGRLDARGNLTLTGRTKLLIDVGGRKVNPLEVEAVLLEHPLVDRCVVIPVSVSETVSRLKAVVVPRLGVDPAPEALRRFARDRLVSYKVPRVFEIRQSIPLSKTGKVLRHLVGA